jgi:hypothetical protein
MTDSQAANDLILAPEEAEAEQYVEYQLTSYPTDYTLAVLYAQWKAGDIVIPDYQRKYVWKVEQASKLIESFLLGLPIPQVFFHVDEDNKLLVIDGQQRITSIAYFFDKYFGEEQNGVRKVFRLTGLSERSPFVGKSIDELDSSSSRKLRNAPLRAINIRQLHPQEGNGSVYQIFERLNTGGTALKPQEIRNAVFRGPFNDLLKELNTNASWRTLIGKAEPDKHMRDVELVLRIFALSYFRERYNGMMKAFLSDVMLANKQAGSSEAKSFGSAFVKASNILNSHLPSSPFHRGGPVNSAMVEAVFCATIRNIEHESFLTDIARFETLKADDVFKNSITVSTNASDRVRDRYDRVETLLYR